MENGLIGRAGELGWNLLIVIVSLSVFKVSGASVTQETNTLCLIAQR